MAETGPGESIRVLHIDDELDQTEFVKIFMADIDPSIESFTSASAALKRLTEEQFDCIICDYQMPDMNGVELAKLIRLKDHTPLIIYTGRDIEVASERGVGATFTIRLPSRPASG